MVSWKMYDIPVLEYDTDFSSSLPLFFFLARGISKAGKEITLLVL